MAGDLRDEPRWAASGATTGERRAAGELPELRLKRGEDRRLRAGHLWVFSNEVDTAATPLTGFEPGSIVEIRSDRGQFLGYAYVNPHALICARILSRNRAAPPDRALLLQRLRTALALRTRLYREPYYRLVFGESDGLPGLVLDRYGDVVVGQIATVGMETMRAEVEAAVAELIAPRALVWKNDGSARDLEGLQKYVAACIGRLPQELSLCEGPLRFAVPLSSAQKTGWFYDQTANRELLRRLLPAEARVLDAFSYAGAWALTALQAGAREAVCVDSSEGALACAERNARANGFELTPRRGDVFDVLESMAREGERFDVVVLDPPAFIKRKKDAARGLAAYRRLNELALRLLERDALLVSCSCSYHLAADELVGAIQAAARHTDRFVQIVAAGGQSPDHPVHPAIAETRYLKAYFCRVVVER